MDEAQVRPLDRVDLARDGDYLFAREFPVADEARASLLACGLAHLERVDDHPAVGAADLACRQRLGEPPVGVHPSGAGGLDQQVRGLSLQQRLQPAEVLCPVDVHPKPLAELDGLLSPGALRSRRDTEEQLLAGVEVTFGEVERRLAPVRVAVSARRDEVVPATAGVDVELAVIVAAAGGYLDVSA